MANLIRDRGAAVLQWLRQWGTAGWRRSARHLRDTLDGYESAGASEHLRLTLAA